MRLKSILKNSIHHYPGLTERRLQDELNVLRQQFILSSQIFTEDSLLNILATHCQTGKPLEYLVHEKYFYDAAYYVNPNCLIPRSETEILVEACLEKLKQITADPIAVGEIGVGSGAVFLSILRRFERKINLTATDISFEALQIARWNNFLKKNSYSPKHKVEFIHADRLDSIEQKFHLILSNPPYIKRDHTGIHAQVVAFEPHQALFIDENYEAWFEKLFAQVYGALLPDGYFFMEGHESELANLINLPSAQAFSFREIKKDYTGRDRFLIFKK